jgi:hypothetical protein
MVGEGSRNRRPSFDPKPAPPASHRSPSRQEEKKTAARQGRAAVTMSVCSGWNQVQTTSATRPVEVA